MNIRKRNLTGVVSLVAFAAVWMCSQGTIFAQSVSFTSPISFPAGPNLWFVATRDLNNDGKLDLVLTPNISSNVAVLLGNGDGTFGGATPFPTGQNPTSVVIEDFNNDGKWDLAISNMGGNFITGNNVAILLGNGDGTFNIGGNFFVGGIGPEMLTAGDFDNDGNTDLVIGGDAGISLLRGKGDGTFYPYTSLTAGANPHSVAVGDFNRDGKLDVAVANLGSNNISILLGNGDCSFYGPTNFPAGTFAPSVGIGVMAVADFNGDGKLDIAVANLADKNVSILLGNGAGSFGSPANFPAGDAPFSVTSGDFNGDGKLDLAVSNFFPVGVNSYPSGDVSILLGNGDGSFGSRTIFPAGLGVHPYMTVAGDFNSDHKLDLAVANDELNVLILLNSSSTTPPPSYRLCVLYDQTKAVRSGATIPIKLQLCDSNGNNVSSPQTVLTATSLVQMSTNISGAVQDAGSANPDNNFRYDSTIAGTGGYIFNFKTSGLNTGTYLLSFTAGSDPASYSVQFQVK